MKNSFASLLIAVTIFLSNQAALTQSEAGLPFITSFTPQDYNAGVSNWAVLQDQRGVMYFGNDQGVLEYDGKNWRIINLTNSSNTRSLAMNDSGRIYVGGVGDFGYLQANQKGSLEFISLMPHIPDSLQLFTDVWHTFSTTQGIYFLTDRCLFLWTGSEMKAWPSEDRYHVGAIINDKFYVRTWNRGLMNMEDGQLQLVPNGEQFADERIYVMLPYDENRILIGTRTQGLMLYDGREFTVFKTEVDDFLLEHHLYLPGAILPDGSFALGTFTGGLVIIDRDGKLLMKLDKTSGLSDNAVCYVYPEPNGAAVWLGLYKGIARVEIPSPLSFYHDRAGLEFPVMDITRHKGLLYAGTNIGIFYLDPQKGLFKQIPGTKNQCFQFEHVDDKLLATALEDGVYSLDNGNATVIRKSVNYDYRANSLLRSKNDPSLIFVGLDNGVSVLRWRNRIWIDEGRIEGVHEDAVSLAEDKNGNLWVGSISFGAVKVQFPNGTTDRSAFKHPILSRFNEKNNLPKGIIYAFSGDNDVLFTAQNGLMRFDESTQTFYSDSIFTNIGYDASSLQTFIVEDNEKNVWLNLGRETVFAKRKNDGSYDLIKTPFLRFANQPAYTIFPEQDGTVWFGGSEAIIRYDPSIKKEYSRNYPALIREVRVNEDSVIYGGTTDGEELLLPKIDYSFNNLRFGFTALTYDSPEAIRIQTMLEGFDSHWSAWTAENNRVYTNLPFGEYTFRVQAKNVYDQLSEEAVFNFKILPPWYRTWWAYGGYALFFGLFLFVGLRIERNYFANKERERAEFREAKLRAESAEALAKSETERKKNIELLSEIGREITASLDMDTIFSKLYKHVNELADATIFGVGIYHADKEEIHYRLAIEKGKKYKPYTRDTRDKNQFPVWCIENRKPIFINNVEKEFHKYLKEYSTESESGKKLETGETPGVPHSMIYLPLITKERVIGVITIQSYEKDAYTKYHLNLLQNLATYTTIAFDNAEAYTKLNATLENLKATQEKLVTQEKLASLGALTAGIAHEIKNPLNFVNNFAELSQELVDELREELEKNADKVAKEDVENIRAILDDIEQNSKKINEHGKRADSIVKSMLQHSRGNKGERQPTNLNAMLEEDINLAYHGLRAQDSGFNSTIEKDLDENLGKVEVVPQDISRVFLNIITNGFYAAHQRGLQNGKDFSPKLSVQTRTKESKVEIRIRDNGHGIPEDVREKIFQPFFTTKPTGQGTGLGLSISYDIVVQEHNGEIRVDSKEGEFTEFIITLPR